MLRESRFKQRANHVVFLMKQGDWELMSDVGFRLKQGKAERERNGEGRPEKKSRA